MKLFRKVKRLLKKSFWTYRKGQRLYFKFIFYSSLIAVILKLVTKYQFQLKQLVKVFGF